MHAPTTAPTVPAPPDQGVQLARPHGGARPRFVGRSRELATISAALAALQTGRGSLLLLAGEPGIGKTRLAEELAGAAVAAGVRVRWGRCHEAEGRPPYWPWAQILQSAARDREPEALAAAADPDALPLVELIPELRALRPADAATPSAVDAETARFRLFQAVTASLCGMATRQPLLLVLDDVHWADLPSLLLLEFLAHELARVPIAVVVTYREVEVRQAPVLAEAIGRLCRRGSTLALGGLSVDEVSHFVNAAAGQAVPSAVAARLHAQTEGNPFFLDEIVRLFRDDGDWLAARSAGVPVSQGVRATIRQRLAPLGPDALRILAAGAVVGREFDVPLVAAALGMERHSLLDTLAPALASEVVHVTIGRPGYCRFSHALIRETIYEEIPPGERSALHRTVGELLEKRHADEIDPWLADLAHHFFEAATGGDDARAVDYAERAGRRALRSLAYEEAAAQLGRALHLIEIGSAADPRRQGELLLDLGQANNRAGLGDESKRIFHRAAALARRIAAPDLLARAATGLCEVGVTWAEIGRRDEEMIGVLEEALAQLAPDATVLRARVMARLATELLSSGPTPRTEQLSADAVALARGTGDGICLAHTLLARIHCRSHPDQLAERAALIAEVLDLTGGRGELAVNAYLWRLGDEQHADRPTAVRGTRETLVRGAVELRQPGGLWLVHAVRAQEALLEGRFADAERAVQSMVEQPSFKANVEQAATAALFLIKREQGGHRDLALALEGLAAQYPAMSAWRSALAMLWADDGNAERARAELDALTGDGLASICRDSTWLFSVSCLADACGTFGTVAQAELLHATLAPHAAANTMAGPLFYLAPVAYYLGLLARVRGAFPEAASYLDDAATRARRLGARPAQARILLARARVVEDAIAAGRPLPGEDHATAVRLRCEAASLREAMNAAGSSSSSDPSSEAAAKSASGGTSATAPTPARDGDTTTRRRTQLAELDLTPDVCTIAFAGRTHTVKAVKGLHYLARLLAEPGREFHVLDLVAGAAGAAGEHETEHAGTLGPLLDVRARTELARRLEQLRDAQAEAESAGDAARAERARSEIEQIGDQLAAAVGLGGRDRRVGGAAERARAAVTKAVRAAIERIGRADAELADLLTRTVRTGTFCSYVPLGAIALIWSIRVAR